MKTLEQKYIEALETIIELQRKIEFMQNNPISTSLTKQPIVNDLLYRGPFENTTIGPGLIVDPPGHLVIDGIDLSEITIVTNFLSEVGNG